MHFSLARDRNGYDTLVPIRAADAEILISNPL